MYMDETNDENEYEIRVTIYKTMQSFRGNFKFNSNITQFWSSNMLRVARRCCGWKTTTEPKVSVRYTNRLRLRFQFQLGTEFLFLVLPVNPATPDRLDAFWALGQQKRQYFPLGATRARLCKVKGKDNRKATKPEVNANTK